MIPGTTVLILVLIIVRHWVNLPVWFSIILVVIWLGKEVIMFPFVWRAYDHHSTPVVYAMIGQRGVAKERLAPTGYVLVRGELWLAENIGSQPFIERGMWVQVKKIEGLKIFVVPEKHGDGIQTSGDRSWMAENDVQQIKG